MRRRQFILGGGDLLDRVLGEEFGAYPDVEIFIVGNAPERATDKGVNLEFLYPLGTKVMAPSEDGMYQLSEGGLYVPVTEEGIVFGREPGADIQINDPEMSAIHARLAYDSGLCRLTVRDLGSLNGTKIDRLPAHNFERTVDYGAELKMGQGYVRVLAPKP